VALAPDAAEFRRNLCPIYERVGRYEDAVRIGRQALDMNQYDLQTLHNMALVYYRQLQLDDSIACAVQWRSTRARPVRISNWPRRFC
jgi:Flp pilus assembly protein TadD